MEVEMLTRDLSYLVEVSGGKVGLTALQICARDIEKVLGDLGQLPVAELESQYEAKFGRELPLEPLGFESVSELLAAMNSLLQHWGDFGKGRIEGRDIDDGFAGHVGEEGGRGGCNRPWCYVPVVEKP